MCVALDGGCIIAGEKVGCCVGPVVGKSMDITLDCGWGRIEVGEFSKPHDLSVSNFFPFTKVGARLQVSFAVAFAGGRVFGRGCFDFNCPSSFSRKQVAGQLNSFELMSSLSSKHKSEGVRCTSGPLATVGVASMAMANTIAVMNIAMRAVAVVILLGAAWELLVTNLCD